MAFAPPRLFHRRQAGWWTLAAGLAVTTALGLELHRDAVEMDRQRLAMRAAEVQSQLDARLEKSEMLLHNLRDYLTWTGVSRDDVFDRWCYENGLTINCKWIHGLLVATNRQVVTWPESVLKWPKFWVSNEWYACYAFAGAHPIECDIALRSSITNTKRFLASYDLKGTVEDRKPFSLIINNSRLGMSHRRTVMLDAKSNAIAGTFFQVPVFRPEMAGLVADAMAIGLTKPGHLYGIRWLHLASVIVAPLDFGALAQSVWDGSPADLGMELFSSTNQTAETWLNMSEGAPRAADPTFKAYLTHRQVWPMYGHKFSIFFHTTPLFEAQSPRRLAKIAVMAGTGLTLLATVLVGVAQRARARQEVMTEQIREARDALGAAQRERSRISRDLHDGTVQSLYAIQLGLGRTVEKIEKESGRARRELLTVRGELDAVIAEIRQFITIESRAEQPVDLSAVLRALVLRAQAGTTAQIHLHCDPGVSERLAGDQAVQLANIAREALSNTLRHAKAQRVDMKLFAEGETTVLEISDDGQGFDPKLPSGSGVGLASMMARAQEMGGTLEIQSASGRGARIVVRVPARRRKPIPAEPPDNTNGQS